MGTDVQTFKRTLGTMIDKGDLALPSTVQPETFRNAAVIAFQTNPDLRNASPESVFTALRHLAGAGLMPDGREAALVIYKGRAQAQPMVSGLRKIARNSGQVVSLFDDVVYEGEQIVFRIVDGARTWDHVMDDGSPINAMTRGGKIIGAYAAAKLKDGTSEIEVMTLEQIEKRRKASPNQKSNNPTGIWADWYDEMARKTAVRALCKRLPMSPEDYNRIERDPTFREVETKDVTPAETTAERLARIAAEKKAEEPQEEILEGDVVEGPAFDPDLVFPGDDAFTEGVKAFQKGVLEDDCPHEGNPEYSNWIGGHREASRAAA